jgi:hypothetical protein
MKNTPVCQNPFVYYREKAQKCDKGVCNRTIPVSTFLGEKDSPKNAMLLENKPK